MTHTVGESACDLEFYFARLPWPARIVVAHLPRGPHEYLFREIGRDATGTGERADAEALGIQGRFLLPTRRVDDCAGRLVERRLAIPRKTDRALRWPL